MKENFLKKKDVIISFKRYGQDALGAMALGLFCSLLAGLILKNIGLSISHIGILHPISNFLIEIGSIGMSLMGSAIGISIAYSLNAPQLVLFSSIVVGHIGANNISDIFHTQGGPAGAFIATIVAVEIGKLVSKETKIDIIVTPFTTIIVGSIISKLLSPLLGISMKLLGEGIDHFTELQPLFMGFLVATSIGLALTAPISSAALCIMLDISGISAGAATAGCAAQMIGFAFMTYKENGISGVIAQGIGTSMLQIPNILKNWWLLLPPTLASGVCGIFSAYIFKMKNGSIFAGMGTSGFVGQIGYLQNAGINTYSIITMVFVHIILPIIIVLPMRKFLEKKGKITFGDGKLAL